MAGRRPVPSGQRPPHKLSTSDYPLVTGPNPRDDNSSAAGPSPWGGQENAACSIQRLRTGGLSGACAAGLRRASRSAACGRLGQELTCDEVENCCTTVRGTSDISRASDKLYQPGRIGACQGEFHDEPFRQFGVRLDQQSFLAYAAHLAALYFLSRDIEEGALSLDPPAWVVVTFRQAHWAEPVARESCFIFFFRPVSCYCR